MCRVPRRTRLWIIGLVASGAAACGSSPTTPAPTPSNGITSIVVTSPVGLFAGDSLAAGVAILEIITRAVPNADFFRDPHVDLKVAIYATLLLIVAGAVAGFFPARRAAAVQPVEALRDE